MCGVPTTFPFAPSFTAVKPGELSGVLEAVALFFDFFCAPPPSCSFHLLFNETGSDALVSPVESEAAQPWEVYYCSTLEYLDIGGLEISILELCPRVNEMSVSCPCSQRHSFQLH